ncbi:palmitoyltransferase ZDHHC13-like [Corvus moneduloides]|uniref:palmitoyltransferase ZDHHC13-like n=1 Tax=Corvus moneduloides TaxID=1196302 RepID=UPI001363ECC2|nr:palmitoyltransferase ZDHHC13-like [Corvus moneduloides]
MAGSGPACKSHCHGPHRPHMHNRQSAHGEQGLPGPYPVAEDPSSCDIVKATQMQLFPDWRTLKRCGRQRSRNSCN